MILGVDCDEWEVVEVDNENWWQFSIINLVEIYIFWEYKPIIISD